MNRNQRTLKDTLEFTGVGIHTGKSGRVRLCPGEVNSGIVFQGQKECIPARVEYVVDTTRSTKLGRGEETICTVEHLMAALWGTGVDNAVVEFEGPEVPILDGSAYPFVQGIQRLGLVEQGEPVRVASLQEPCFVARGDSIVLAMPAVATGFEGAVSYPCPEVGTQRFCFSADDDFVSQLAPARTFGFWEEVKQLLAAGLGLGGDLSNALIYGRPAEVVPPDASVDELASQTGLQTESGVRLRFANEAVRHKVLDLMGDIALLGCTVQASFLAIRAGHSLHVELARKLAEVLVIR